MKYQNTQTTAHTNIAFIKYWGKKNAQLNLPCTDSLSLTLDGYFTTTTSKFISDNEDQIWLNGQRAPASFFKRTQKFLDLCRQLNHCKQKIQVITTNHVPTAAGLASSASGFAALAGSLNKLFQMHLSRAQLSCLARRGSGSAARSIYGGWVWWQHGSSDQTSLAVPIDEHPQLPICLLSVVFNDQPKKIFSTQGMERARTTSPFYSCWPHIVASDLSAMKQAIATADLQQIGQIAENNCLAMHALNWSARPAFSYFTDATWKLIHLLQQWRHESQLVAYATIDAGPNVKIITQQNQVQQIQARVQHSFPQAQTTILYPGPGIQ